ncbi:MAG: [protein-PII] uridylyltransferase, partial [Rhodospirillales bacterium]
MQKRAHPRRPREIIDRKNLTVELDRLAGELSPAKARARVLTVLKRALAKGNEAVRKRFERREDKGLESIRAQAFLVDQLVRLIHDFAVHHVFPASKPEAAAERMSVLATGGYGRGGLAPFSDVDLMFLLPPKPAEQANDRIEFILYMLWDLGLKVGHATRTVKEAVKLAKEDLTIRTSLLETRWLWGNEALFEQFRRAFQSDVLADSGPAFVEAKLAERDERVDKMGDTRYVLEPNIKEGKGGLRDLQTLFWIAKYLYQVDDVKDLVDLGVLSADDARRFQKADNFLWTVRCHLHYLAGRPEERLTFNVQKPIGERMGYKDRAGALGVERFMKHYFLVAKDVGDLTRILCAVLENQHQKRRFRLSMRNLFQPTVDGFKVDNGRLSVEDFDEFRLKPVKMIRLFREAQFHGLDIQPEALRWITQNLTLINGKVRANEQANALFLDILCSKREPEIMLTRMNEAGVFGRFVPDFGRVVAQMQYDMYHVYTVDEHTIRAIAILARIERGDLEEDHPLATEVMPDIQARRVLYVAVLLHDIAKGRGGDHSELGAKVALKLCPRFGLNEWETETVAWLVLHHLDMSRIAFKRDLDDPKTIEDFAALVETPERMKLLLCLTVADIRAVGPNVWNEWKAGLLRELYYKTEEAVTGGGSAERRRVRVDRAKGRLTAQLQQNGWVQDEIDTHLARGFPDYWLAHDTETLTRHAHMIREAERGDQKDATGVLYVSAFADLPRDVTELTIYTADHPGLFARLSGAIALSGLSIVDAKIATLANGMALDILTIIDPEGHAVEEAARLNRLTTRIEQSLRGDLNLSQELAARSQTAQAERTRLFRVPPRVLIDNKASSSHTVIEISALDRPGLLFEITGALADLGLQISSARINTHGEKAS